MLILARPAWGDPWHWSACGDSLTEHDRAGYPYLLQSERRPLRNLAMMGGRLWDFVDEQLPRALAERSSLVTVCIGLNDVLQPLQNPSAPQVLPEEYAQVLEWAVASLQLSYPGRVVVLGTVPSTDAFPALRGLPQERLTWARQRCAAYSRAVEELARRRGCRLWRFPLLAGDEYQEDGIHPNPRGDAHLAASLEPLLPTGDGPSPPAIPEPTPLPLRVFPLQGPAGSAVTLRGEGVSKVLRVVYFPAGQSFRMCPVVSRSDSQLSCEVPSSVPAQVPLWAIYTPHPSQQSPNRLMGTFQVKDLQAPPKLARVDGVWVGVTHSLSGKESALRLDLDQSYQALSGTAQVCRGGQRLLLALEGQVLGPQVRLRGPGLELRGSLSGNDRTLTLKGEHLGSLRRW